MISSEFEEFQAPVPNMAEVSLGMLIDIVDEEWMRDTLPDDGNHFFFPHYTSRSLYVFPKMTFHLRLLLQIFHCPQYLLLGLKILKKPVCLFLLIFALHSQSLKTASFNSHW